MQQGSDQDLTTLEAAAASEHRVHGAPGVSQPLIQSASYRVQRSHQSMPASPHDVWMEEGSTVRLGTSKSRSIPNVASNMVAISIAPASSETLATSSAVPSQPFQHPARTVSPRIIAGNSGTAPSTSRAGTATKTSAQKAASIGHRDNHQTKQQQQAQAEPAVEVDFVAACGTGARGVAALNRNPRMAQQQRGAQPAAAAQVAADSPTRGFLPLQLRRQRNRPSSPDPHLASPTLTVTTPPERLSASPVVSVSKSQLRTLLAEAWVESAGPSKGGLDGPDSPPLLGSPTPVAAPAINSRQEKPPLQSTSGRLLGECQGFVCDLFGTDLHPTLLSFLAIEEQLQEEMGRRQE